MNCLLFYFRSEIAKDLVSNRAHTHTHRTTATKTKKKIILDAWNLQSRLSCSETKEIKYRHITREKKTSNESRWNIVRTQFETDQQTHLNILFNIDNKHHSGGMAKKMDCVEYQQMWRKRKSVQQTEWSGEWMDYVKSSSSRAHTFTILRKQPALIQHRSTRTCNEFALINGSPTTQFLPTINRY